MCNVWVEITFPAGFKCLIGKVHVGSYTLPDYYDFGPCTYILSVVLHVMYAITDDSYIYMHTVGKVKFTACKRLLYVNYCT